MTPTRKAPAGENVFLIIFIMVGLQARGTSITNPFPYQKKSFKFARPTRRPIIPTIRFSQNKFSKLPSNFKTPNHKRKQVRNTAREKSNPAKSVFFLSSVFVRIVVRSKSITAKAQGLILSASAAGAITAKNPRYSINNEKNKIRLSLYEYLEKMQEFLRQKNYNALISASSP